MQEIKDISISTQQQTNNMLELTRNTEHKGAWQNCKEKKFSITWILYNLNV